jgi:proteasome lid subunit RPN8/RPN11
MISERILFEIKKYAKSKDTEESCGIIYQKGEELSFLKCENLSKNKSVHFEIDPRYLVEYNVFYIYHSHVNASAKPSIFDIKMYNQILIPFLIYSLRDDDFYIYKK